MVKVVIAGIFILVAGCMPSPLNIPKDLEAINIDGGVREKRIIDFINKSQKVEIELPTEKLNILNPVTPKKTSFSKGP